MTHLKTCNVLVTLFQQLYALAQLPESFVRVHSLGHITAGVPQYPAFSRLIGARIIK